MGMGRDQQTLVTLQAQVATSGSPPGAPSAPVRYIALVACCTANNETPPAWWNYQLHILSALYHSACNGLLWLVMAQGPNERELQEAACIGISL